MRKVSYACILDGYSMYMHKLFFILCWYDGLHVAIIYIDEATIAVFSRVTYIALFA